MELCEKIFSLVCILQFGLSFFLDFSTTFQSGPIMKNIWLEHRCWVKIKIQSRSTFKHGCRTSDRFGQFDTRRVRKSNRIGQSDWYPKKSDVWLLKISPNPNFYQIQAESPKVSSNRKLFGADQSKNLNFELLYFLDIFFLICVFIQGYSMINT